MKQKLSERRHFIRHPIAFPLEYTVIKVNGVGDGVGEVGRSKTINMSQGGLLFSTKHSVSENALILIKMPFRDKLFSVRARVTHCEKSKDTKLYNIGVCFFRFSDAFKVKLIEQMYLISEYRDLRSMQLGKEVSLEEASREWIKRYSERFKRLYW